MRIVVTGAAGQLGSTVVQQYRDRAEIIPALRQTLDVGDTAAVDAFIARHRPDAVINCAAYNDVDGAEDHASDALRANALAVRALARAAAAAGAIFVHYSTDFVFDGLNPESAYTEDDEPAPQSVYACSKLLGEWFAAECPRHYVLRVESLFGGSQRRSSVDRIAGAIRQKEPARVFVDRTVTPSYVQDVADATWKLMDSGAPSGLYHVVNSGVTTWLELAKEIGRVLGVDADLIPVKVADVKMKARRPQYAALSNAKLASVGITMPTWQDGLARYLSTL
jgi:dTDP-4-dehydrorhamnose reductase